MRAKKRTRLYIPLTLGVLDGLLVLLVRRWGKERLARDSVREATREETGESSRESGELKQLVGELSLRVSGLRISGHHDAG